MIHHTHDKTHFCNVVGRTVTFMARPALTRQKKYREPLVIRKKRYANKSTAEIAAKQWEEGILV